MIPLHENLAGKTVVITGGSGVLCSAMARASPSWHEGGDIESDG